MCASATLSDCRTKRIERKAVVSFAQELEEIPLVSS